MGKMKRFLATLLVATMLIGNNGIAYAAEVSGGTDEVAQETAVEETESVEDTDSIDESDQSEAEDISEENSSSDSEQEETDEIEEQEETDAQQDVQTSETDEEVTDDEETDEESLETEQLEESEEDASGVSTSEAVAEEEPESEESETGETASEIASDEEPSESASGATTSEIAAVEEPENEAVEVKITATAVDEDGKEIDEIYNSVELPLADGETLSLTEDPLGNVVSVGENSIIKYTFTKAVIEDHTVKAIKQESAPKKDGTLIPVYSFTDDGTNWIAIEKDTDIKLVYNGGKKRVYKYEDNNVKVTATLERADAIPDDAQLKVTPVTEQTEVYNYAAYMKALNDSVNAPEEMPVYTADNTLLYDFAFMAAEVDAEGNATGKTVEYEPAAGTVKLNVVYKKRQLTEDILATDAENVSIIHLPLNSDVKTNVDSTEEAVNISADDIKVERVESAEISVEGKQTAEYTLDSFSVTATVTEDGITYHPAVDKNTVTNYNIVLGRAVEYGVLANEYKQTNHTQTNFATNKYTVVGDNCIEADLSGSGAVPFIVTEISSHLRFGGSTSSDTKTRYDVYTDAAYQSQDPSLLFRVDNADKITVNPIYQPKDTVKGNVDTMIGHIQDESNILKNKAATVEVSDEAIRDQNDFTLDITRYDSDDVIYINVDNNSKLYATLQTGGLKIKKKADQIVVFNCSGTNVFIREYKVIVDGVTIGSQTSPGDKGTTKTETEIVKKVIWNFYNASSVTLQDTAGLFLAPKDSNVEVGQTGGASSGWLATAGKLTGAAEWHFTFHERKYDAQGNIAFSGRKEVRDDLADEATREEVKNPQQYEFELYKTGSDFSTGSVGPIQTVRADSTTKVAFEALNITDADLDSQTHTGTFYYVIKEKNAGTTHDGITNWTGELDIKVVASDTDLDGRITFVISSWKYLTAEDKAAGRAASVNTDVEMHGTEFTFGAFPNKLTSVKTQLEATKSYDGWEEKQKTDEFKFRLMPGTASIGGTSPMPKNAKTETLDDGTKITYVEGTATKIAPLVKFAEIEFKEKGTYTYTIQEFVSDSDRKDYIIYDTEPHTVTVTVSEDQNGALKTSVDYGAPEGLTITNTYTSTNKSLEVTKSFNKWGDASEFSFTLTAGTSTDKSGNTIPTPMPEAAERNKKATTNSKTAVFGNIVFEQEGTFNYTITEDEPENPLPGVTYNTDPHTATVIVEKNTDGTLAVKSVTYDGKETSLTVTNTYDAKGSQVLEGAKTLTGREFKEGDSFTFTVSGSEGAPMPKPATVTITPKSGTSAAIVFNAISYGLSDAGKTYTYTVTESGNGDGITNDTGTHTVTVTIEDNGNGTLEVTPQYSDGKQLLFENKYDAKGDITLGGTKAIEGRDFKAGDTATFKIEAVTAGAPLPSPETVTINPTSGKSQEFSFNKINYQLSDLGDAKTKTFEYKVTESVCTMSGVTKDSSEKTVKVTVTDNGTGKLSVVKTEDSDALTFKNVYDATGTAVLEAEKKITGKEWPENATVTFTLTAKTADAPMPDTDGRSVELKAAGTATFGSITYHLNDAEHIYEYTITETAEGFDAGWSANPKTIAVKVTVGKDKGDGTLEDCTIEYEPGDAVVTNTYASEGQAHLEVTKAISGSNWPKDATATFTVTADPGVKLPEKTTVTLSEPGSVDFGMIKYGLSDAEKTYKYTITETTNGFGTGWSADPQTKKIIATVKVGKDLGGGKLADSTVTYDPEDQTITNKYESKGEVTFEAKKVLEGTTLKDQQFEFVLKEGNQTLQTKYNDDKGKVAFDKISYTQADITTWKADGTGTGTKTYTVSETAKGEGGYTYDSKTVEIEVTLTDDGKGNIKATPDKTLEDLTFTNTYDAKGDITLGGTKAIDKRDFKEGDTATFKIEAVTAGAPLPSPETVTINPTSGKSQAFSFEKISYKLSDLGDEKTKTFEYKVTESVCTMSGVTKDSSTKTVKVTVTDNGTGELSVEKTEDSDALTFTNKYNATGEITLGGTKAIEGRDFKEGDTATFKIEAVTAGAPLPSPETVTINPTSGKSQAFSFEKISYKLSDLGDEKTKTFEYKVTESVCTMSGVTKDSSTKTVKVTVTDNGTGELTVVKTEDSDALTFTNKYDAKGEITLGGTKAIDKRDFKEGDTATFKIEAVTAGAPLPSPETVTINPTSGKSQAFSFEKISYKLSDLGDEKTKTFEYKVTESVCTMSGVTKDNSEKTVKITVTDNGTGELSVVKTEDSDDLTFTNKYDAKGDITLGGTKAIEGRDFKEGDTATFKIEAVTAGAPLPSPETVTINPTSGKSQAFSFEKISYKLSDLGDEKTKTFEYKVTESVCTMSGVTKDSSEKKVKVTVTDNGTGNLSVVKTEDSDALNFTNKYDATGTAVLEAEKKITGKEWPENATVTFTLTAKTEGAPMPDASGRSVELKEAKKAAFGTITYHLNDAEKTYEYTITETAVGFDAGWSANPKTIAVKVTVGKDKGDGTLEASTIEYVPGDAVVTNTYAAEGQAHLEVTKAISGSNWPKDATATFTVTADPGVKLPEKTTVTLSEPGSVDFGMIKYGLSDAEKTYKYTITETTNGFGTGWSADPQTKKIIATVKVGKDLGGGKLADSTVTYDPEDQTITNKYASNGEVTFEAKKVLEGTTLKDKQFEFVLKEGNQTLQTKYNDAQGKVAFDAISYSQADITTWKENGTGTGTKTYTVSETAKGEGGYTYDSKTVEIEVTLTDDGKGNIKATPDKTLEDLTFTNKYESKGEVTFEAKKVLEGTTLKDKQFEFVLKEGNKTLQTKYNDAQGKVAFDAISYSQADITTWKENGTGTGTKTYTVSETNKGEGGYTYDSKTVEIEVTLEDDGKGNIKATPDKTLEDLSFTNKYEAKGEVTFEAKKVLEGTTLRDKQFEFVLKEGNKTLQTKYNDAQGKVAFDKISYTQKDITGWKSDGTGTGTKTYTVSETAKGEGGYTYDSKTVEIEVTLTDDGKGNIKATPDKTLEDLTFTNKYESKGEVTFEAKKVLEGTTLRDKQFEFVLKEGEKTLQTKYNDAQGKVAFDAISYSQADITTWKEDGTGTGTKTYTVSETAKGEGGYTYDSKTVEIKVTLTDDGKGNIKATPDKTLEDLTFTNKYESKGEVTFEAKKVLEGTTLRDKQFEFVLKEGEKTLQTKYNDAQGKVAFDAISYTQADITTWKEDGTGTGTKTYTVSETAKGEGGYTYDNKTVEIEVTLEDDGKGNIKATPDKTLEDLTFNNKYESKGHVDLEAQKELKGETGKVLKPEQFSFELYEGGTLVQTKKNNAEGKVTFDAIDYTQDDITTWNADGTGTGTKTYTIKEIVEIKPGYTFDTNEKTVTVTLTDDGAGKITAKAEYDGGSALFTNTYEARGSVVLKAHKTLENRKLDDKQFIFELYNEFGAKVQTVKNDAAGNVTFRSIGYKKPGTYKYTIKELVQNKKGYTFDKSEKKVVVTVTDLDNGILAVEVKYDGSSKIPEFINKYDASVKVSKTDVASGKELEGAKIQIIDKDGKVVAEWTSTKKAHEVTGLKTGETYTLHEEVAPDGYTIAADTKFTIDESGKVTSTGTITKGGVLLVEDSITSVKVSKTDVADGKELEGAKIQVIDKDGKVVAEWTSTKEAHEVKGLKTGETYTLHEEVAPDGYTIAADTKFSIDETGKVTSTGTVTEGGVMLIEDAMTSVKVSKVDVADGKELEGAKIQIKDEKGKVVAEWTSGKEAHEVKGLKTGVKYTLHEEVAPNGYTVAADTTFTIDENGKVTSTGTITEGGVMLVEDDMTTVKVSKVDAADGKELAGAKIQILDENGKVVAEWTSTKEVHVVKGLKTGVKYTLHEVVAPNGYEIAADTTFTIDKYGKITSSGTITKDGVLLVKDAQIKKTKKKDSTHTGDEAPLGVLFGGLGIGAVGLAVLLEDRRRRGKKF